MGGHAAPSPMAGISQGPLIAGTGAAAHPLLGQDLPIALVARGGANSIQGSDSSETLDLGTMTGGMGSAYKPRRHLARTHTPDFQFDFLHEPPSRILLASAG
ncbi:uncharacterized protein PG986_011402 [Apiospora aurea]|uniref:Uncharacterized protein n=1 Tax=Apiospora aurea TaxID=335848 RepID=A0ABR1Q5I1_9PEZI